MCCTSPELRSASSYGHFTAAKEFWSQCRIFGWYISASHVLKGFRLSASVPNPGILLQRSFRSFLNYWGRPEAQNRRSPFLGPWAPQASICSIFSHLKTASKNMDFQHRPKTSQNSLAINFRTPKG